MSNNKAGAKYGPAEVDVICNAGLRVCEDSVNGTQNKVKDLQRKMLEFYNRICAERCVTFAPRDGANLWRKFKNIGKEVPKFIAAYSQAEATLPSGQQDVMPSC